MLKSGVYFLQHKEKIDTCEAETITTHDGFSVEIPSKYHNDKEIIEAKWKEIKKWKKYSAFEEVDYIGQPLLGSRWVVNEKEGVPKARFVVKGFHEQEYPRSDSPTAAKDSLKLFLSIAANEDFKLKSMDVTSAFLQGTPLDRDIYIEPPEECVSKGKVWKLLKGCYGLNDASRKWFMAVRETLVNLGMQSVSGDDAFFFLTINGSLMGMCILHVDDFLLAGNEQFFTKIQDTLTSRFTFG